jgi:hypothetical protein
VLLDEEVAGKDATEAFFGLHRHEVLLTPRYARLQIGTVEGQKEQIPPPVLGALSQVPYAEPSWLSKGYHSPYYKDHHRRFQAWMRKFVEEIIKPDAQEKEESGKFAAQSTVDEQASVISNLLISSCLLIRLLQQGQLASDAIGARQASQGFDPCGG